MVLVLKQDKVLVLVLKCIVYITAANYVVTSGIFTTGA